MASEDVSIRDFSNLLLDYASTLMGVGVHTSRAVRNVTRIADAFGYVVDMTIFQKNITMTVQDKDDDCIRRTSVRKIRHGAVNFETISQLSRLSWKAYDHHIPFAELKLEYDRIVSKPRIPDFGVLVLVSLANASFCRLFGGDTAAMGLVFAATFIGFFIRQTLMARGMNHMAIFFLVAFAASMVASLGIWLHLGNTPQIALASSVLFLIPGVHLINSIVDIIDGHVLIGISRAVNAAILIVCIALGLSATLLILGSNVL